MKGKREHYILFAIDNGSLSLFASYGSLGHDCWHRSLLTGFMPNQTLQLCWKVTKISFECTAYKPHKLAGAKTTFLSGNSLEIDVWKTWILWKIRHLKMWILWKMRLWKCEFCEKWDIENVNFVKKWYSHNVNFLMNYGFLLQFVSSVNLFSAKYMYEYGT